MKTLTHNGKFVVSISVTRIEKTLSIEYLVTKFDGEIYAFAGATTLGLINDTSLSDEDFAKEYYLDNLAPIFVGAELPNNPAVISKDKREQLAELHIRLHRTTHPLGKKMKQTQAEFALVKSFGIVWATPVLMALDNLPRTTIVRRLYAGTPPRTK